MSYNRRDCAYSYVTGRLHDVCANETALTIDGQVVEDYPAMFHVRIAVDGQGVVWVIASGEGVILFREGEVYQHFPGAYGFGFSALRAMEHGVEVYLQGPHLGDGTCNVDVWSQDRVFLRALTAQYSSMGILDIEADGTPISADRGPRVIEGATFWSWTQKGECVVGVSDGGDTAHGCIGLWTGGRLLMSQHGQDIQSPPRLAGASTFPDVAVSGFDTPEPQGITWESWRKYIPPPEQLPPITIPPQRAIWRGDLSGVVQGNIGTGGHPTAIIEDVLWLMPEDESKAQMLYLGPEPPRYGTKAEQIEKTIATALRLGIPVFVYDDGHDVYGQLERPVSAAGCRVVLGIQAYRQSGESLPAFEARVLAKASRVHPWGLVRAGYCPGGATEREMAEANMAMIINVATLPGCIIDLSFGLDRPPFSVWAKQHQQQLTAATPGPGADLRTPPVVIRTPEVSKPPIITGKLKGKDKHQEIATASIGIGAAVVLIWKWLRGRKK